MLIFIYSRLTQAFPGVRAILLVFPIIELCMLTGCYIRRFVILTIFKHVLFMGLYINYSHLFKLLSLLICYHILLCKWKTICLFVDLLKCVLLNFDLSEWYSL